MNSQSLDMEIRARIDAFLTELSGLVKQSALESVQDVLGDGVAPRRRGPGRPRKITIRPGRRLRAMAKRGGRVRRSPEQLAKLQAGVLAQVRSKKGQRLEEIGRAMKTDTAILKKPIAMLLAEKKLKTTGAKRGTKYFVK